MPAAGHSRLSPSGASWWMGCAGGPQRVARLRLHEDRSSSFAAEGTAAHQVREWCLELGFDAYDFIGTEIMADGFLFVVDEDMADALQPGIDRVREFPGRMVVEMQVDTTPWVGLDDAGNRQFGTLDCGIIGDDEIVVNDLKFGRGVPVQAVGNKQLRIYALAFWYMVARHETKAARFRIMIDQPRHAEGGGEWVITLDELLAFGEEVKAAAEATRDPNAKCTPGESQCMWCYAAQVTGGCPEHEEWKLDIIGLKFEEIDDAATFGLEPPLPTGITPERRSYINEHAHVITKWLDRLHADEIADALAGNPTPGRKVVAGRMPPRKHKDDKLSEAWLTKQGLDDDKKFNKKLKSPTQLEKVLGKGVFPESLVERGDPKPVMVPVDDDRPALKTVDEKFDDL